MARNPEAKFSMITVSLNNGNNYGCSAVFRTVINGKPGITFISSGWGNECFDRRGERIFRWS